MANARNLERTYPIDLFTSKSEKDETAWTKAELDELQQGRKKRKDGRGLEEFRPICKLISDYCWRYHGDTSVRFAGINADASMSADGSAYAELGNTKVYCTV